MAQKKKSEHSKNVDGWMKKLFKPRPGTIAAGASQKGMSASQKRKTKEFRESFSGKKK